MSRRCDKYRVDAARYNPRRGGLAKYYFNLDGSCPDPYTTLNYWRRRFASQDCYLKQYYVPYNFSSLGKGRPGNFGVATGYKTGGFSMGNVCPVLYLGRGASCPVGYRGTAACGAGPNY